MSWPPDLRHKATRDPSAPDMQQLHLHHWTCSRTSMFADAEESVAYLLSALCVPGEKRRGRDNDAGSPDKRHKGTVRASHLLVKHRDSRRPSSWKEPTVTRTKVHDAGAWGVACEAGIGQCWHQCACSKPGHILSTTGTHFGPARDLLLFNGASRFGRRFSDRQAC